MTSNIQVFSNPDDNNMLARSFTDEQGNVWFVAKDVALSLGYSQSSSTSQLLLAVPECWKGIKRIDTPGGEQDMLCLSEQGLYFFLNRSDKPRALPYQMWVAGQVIPSIRQHGFYATPDTAQRILDDPDTFINVLKACKEQKARNAELEAQAEVNKPKVIFADAVDAGKDSMLIGNFAEILKQNGIDIGQNRLFAWFREHGCLMNINYGERKNMPTQKSMEQGLFEVKKTVVNNPDGSTRITHTTKLTGKGQIYFLNIFVKERDFNVCV